MLGLNLTEVEQHQEAKCDEASEDNSIPSSFGPYLRN